MSLTKYLDNFEVILKLQKLTIYDEYYPSYINLNESLSRQHFSVLVNPSQTG